MIVEAEPSLVPDRFWLQDLSENLCHGSPVLAVGRQRFDGFFAATRLQLCAEPLWQVPHFSVIDAVSCEERVILWSPTEMCCPRRGRCEVNVRVGTKHCLEFERSATLSASWSGNSATFANYEVGRGFAAVLDVGPEWKCQNCRLCTATSGSPPLIRACFGSKKPASSERRPSRCRARARLAVAGCCRWRVKPPVSRLRSTSGIVGGVSEMRYGTSGATIDRRKTRWNRVGLLLVAGGSFVFELVLAPKDRNRQASRTGCRSALKQF